MEFAPDIIFIRAMFDEILAGLRAKVAIQFDIDRAEIGDQTGVTFLLAVSHSGVANLVFISHGRFHHGDGIHRRRSEWRGDAPGRIRRPVRFVELLFRGFRLFSSVDTRFGFLDEFAGRRRFDLLECRRRFVIDRFEKIRRIGSTRLFILVVQFPLVLQMGERLNVELVEIFRILNDDDVVASERFVRHQIVERVRLDVQTFDGIETVNVARRANGDDVRTFREHFERHGTMNFSFGVSMKVDLDQLFRFQLFTGDRISTEFLQKRNDGGEIEDDSIRCAVRILRREKRNTATVERQTTKIAGCLIRAFETTERIFPFLKSNWDETNFSIPSHLFTVVVK